MKPQWVVEWLVVRAALALLRLLPPVGASNLGGWLARRVGPLLPPSRVADRNLLLALPALDRPARQQLIQAVWDNIGRNLGELPHLSKLKRTTSGPGWEITGAEFLQARVAEGGPAIFVSGHIGNWEMLPTICASFGVHLSGAYRAASNPLVDRLLGQLRTRGAGHDVPMFAKGSAGARSALRHLAAGGTLGLLMDQKQNDGIAVPFFGHPAMTAPALAGLALRFNCPILPGYVHRIGPARFRLVVEPAFDVPITGDRHADILAITTEVNAHLERWIRAWPEGWLWLHRRWPKSIYQAD